jgi:hypothetical protein
VEVRSPSQFDTRPTWAHNRGGPACACHLLKGVPYEATQKDLSWNVPSVTVSGMWVGRSAPLAALTREASSPHQTLKWMSASLLVSVFGNSYWAPCSPAR